MRQFPYFRPTEIKKILNEYGASPRKFWGQNYLIDRNIIEAIFLDIPNQIPSSTKMLAEIGIGLGALTHKILELEQPTLLFEIDPISCRIYKDGLGKDYPDVELIEGDCRDHLQALAGKSAFIFGNLPYYITSEIITDCLEKIPDMTGFLFLVQKEFADRILQEVSSLSIFIQGFGEVSKYRSIKKGSFYPSPKIDSTLLLFQSHTNRKFITPRQISIFSSLLRASFWGKRKKLSTSIRESPPGLFNNEFFPDEESRLDLKRIFLDQLEEKNVLEKRPDELTVPDWLEIAVSILDEFN